MAMTTHTVAYTEMTPICTQRSSSTHCSRLLINRNRWFHCNRSFYRKNRLIDLPIHHSQQIGISIVPLPAIDQQFVSFVHLFVCFVFCLFCVKRNCMNQSQRGNESILGIIKGYDSIDCFVSIRRIDELIRSVAANYYNIVATVLVACYSSEQTCTTLYSATLTRVPIQVQQNP